ncbi:MAG: hypothetical protein ACI8V2_000336 [Candidatus Latescibacterota bacterium]|jgi:hypothetical protein
MAEKQNPGSNGTLIDPIDDVLAPLWQAVDRLEADWRENILGQLVDDASDLLREATDMAVAVIQTPEGDIDDARRALSNRLKALLEDARFVRLRPSVAFVRSEPEAILTSLVLPSALETPLDATRLSLQPDDALDDRMYKVWRRFARQMGVAPRRFENVLHRWRNRPEHDLPLGKRIVRVKSVAGTHLQTGLPMEPALIRTFEVSVFTVQTLKKLWQVFLQEYTVLDERDANCQALENVCEDALTVLVARGELAEQEMALCFASLRSVLRDSLASIDAPWKVYMRAAQLYLGKRRLQKRYGHLETEWERLYRGMLGSFDLSLEIASFNYQATEYAEQIQKSVSLHVESTLLEPLIWMRDRCENDAQETKKCFADLKKGMGDQDARAFAQAVDDLQGQLEQLVTNLSTGYTLYTMQKIDRGSTVAQGRGELGMMADASGALMRQVGGDCDFWIGQPPEWSLGGQPPDVETLRVPVRELIRPLVEGEVQPDLDALQQRLVDLYVQSQTALQDVWKVIRFNVESGIGEMEGDITDRAEALHLAEEIATGGLARASARVGELLVEAEGVLKGVQADVRVVVEEAIEKVEKSLQPGSALDVRLRKLTHLAKSRAEGYAEIGEGVGAVFLVRWRWVQQYVGGVARVSVARLRTLLGIAPVAQQEVQTTIDEADLSTVALEKLPPIYRRLFRMQPLQTDDFLVARADELNTVRQALERWENKRSSALALVGEVGTGKTTLLNCATPKLFHQHEVFRHAFEETVTSEVELARVLGATLGIGETESLEEIKQHVINRERPCIVILEHGHELFIRRIGGLEVVRAFLQLISATSQSVFWCLSMTESAWRYLDAVVEIAEYFPYVIETRNMHASELAQAVMARHDVSGFGLQFMPGDSPSVLRRLKKRADKRGQQEILREIFFEHLADASKGNVQIALFYWLRSIKEIKDDTVFVTELKPLRFAFLNTLNADKLFTLAAMLQHGTLTVGEHVSVFRSSKAMSQGLLETLAASNLIQIREGAKDDGDVRYAVNPVMRRPVVDLLWNRHIFY